MKYTAALVLVTISMVHGSIIGGIGLVGPSSHGAALKGPSAAATLVGPDGSAISSAVEGGAVVAAPAHGGSISAAIAPGVVVGGGHGLIAAPGAWAAPGIWGGAVGHGAVIQGPSAIVATNGNPWGAIGGHGVGIVGHGLGIAGPLGLGHGLWR